MQLLYLQKYPATKLRSLVKSSCAMACEVESEVESLLLDSVIRGYYIYKDVWASYIGEVLRFHHNVHNHHDPLAFWVR